MKNTIFLVLILITFKGVSQNEACAFSDGNYHFSVQIFMEDIPTDFNKTSFIQYLETNSAISSTQAAHLENAVLEVYRSYPHAASEPFNKLLRVRSTDVALDAFLTDFNASIQSANILCNCAYTDGFYYNYVRLITDEIPPNDFNKTDFLTHLQTQSTLSNAELDFLNNAIIEVSIGFPSSQTESLQKTLSVVSNYDLMLPYLYNFPESLDLVELLCGEPQLTTHDVRLEEAIKIIPNPVTNASQIIIQEHSAVKELTVYDLHGKIVAHRALGDLKHVAIHTLSLTSGMYFFKFNTGHHSIVKKVLFK